jgi:hypothetical protein
MGISAPRKRNETHRAQIEGYLAGSRRTAAPSTRRFHADRTMRSRWPSSRMEL